MFKKSLRRGMVSMLLVLGLCLVFAASTAQAQTLKLLSSWPDHMIFVKGVYEPFRANLEKDSGGKLQLQYLGPDVVPTMEQFQPLQTGVFDLLYTIGAYHMGTTAIGAAVDAIKPDPTLFREAGIFRYIDQQYNQLGAKLIAIIPVSDLNFLTRVPIEGNKPSFKGLKIRTIATTAPLVVQLGGASVNLPAGEVYSALQKGVIDGTTIITFGAVDHKLYEVTKYMVRPTFGYIYGIILMNLNKYNQLTNEERAVLDQAGAKIELDAIEFFKDKKRKEEKQLMELGMKVTNMQPEDGARADIVYRQTIWDMTEKKSGEIVKKLHELAKTKGMSE